MKKIATIALALVLILSLCACGRRGNNDTTGNTDTPTTAPTILPMPSTNATLEPSMPETTIPHTTEGSQGSQSTQDTTGQGNQGSTNGTGISPNMPMG